MSIQPISIPDEIEDQEVRLILEYFKGSFQDIEKFISKTVRKKIEDSNATKKILHSLTEILERRQAELVKWKKKL